MANPMTTAGWSEFLNEAVYEIYTTSLKDFPFLTPLIANIETTDQKVESDIPILGAGYWTQKNENVDGTLDQFYKGNSQTYTQVMQYSGFKITFEMRLFGKKQMVKMLPKFVAEMAWKTVDFIMTLNFLRATNGSYLGPDGKVWAATDHPDEVGGGTQANRPATFLTLSRVNVQTILQDGAKWTTGRDSIPGFKNAYAIQYHPTKQWLIDEIFDSKDRPDVSDRAKNVLYDSKLVKIANPYFGTSYEEWNILYGAPDQRNIKHFWSKKPGTLRRSQAQTDFDVQYDDIMGFVNGYSHWQDVYFGYVTG